MPPVVPSGLLQAAKPRPRQTTTTTTTMKPKSAAADTPLTAAQIAELTSGLLKLKTKSEQSTFVDTFRRRNFY